jgi:hypothetical protein
MLQVEARFTVSREVVKCWTSSGLPQITTSRPTDGQERCLLVLQVSCPAADVKCGAVSGESEGSCSPVEYQRFVEAYCFYLQGRNYISDFIFRSLLPVFKVEVIFLSSSSGSVRHWRWRSRFMRNISTYLPRYTVSHRGRSKSWKENDWHCSPTVNLAFPWRDGSFFLHVIWRCVTTFTPQLPYPLAYKREWPPNRYELGR